jgi:hypothetical protein
MVPVANGGVLAGSGALLLIWGTRYNQEIGQGKQPKHAAKHAIHDMMTNGKMHDISQMSYQTPAPSDPGAPSTFNFDPGQYFPLDGSVGWSTIQAQMSLALTLASVNIWLGIIVLVAFILMDLIEELMGVFEGKPVAEDTYTVGQRFCNCENPAGFIVGVQILRNLSQNGIVLSSGDAGDQKLLGQIRQHGEALLVAQGLDQPTSRGLIDIVWSSANNDSFQLPAYLKTYPGPQGGGGSTNTDPVTCAQVTAAAATVASAITAAGGIGGGGGGGGGGPDIDTRPMLQNIDVALYAINGELGSLVAATNNRSSGGGGTGAGVDNRPNIDNLTNTLAKFQPDAATYKALVDKMVADGTVSAATGQLLGDNAFVNLIINAIHPVIAGLLSANDALIADEAQIFWKAIHGLLIPFINELQTRGTTILTDVRPTVTRYAPAIEQAALSVFNELSRLETGLPKAIFNGVVAAVNTGGQVTPDNVEDRAFQMLGAAFIVGQGLHLLAALAGYLGYPMSSIWGNNVRLIVDLLAFDEIRSALHDAYFPAAIHEPARQHYNGQFRTRVIPPALAARLVARRFAPISLYDEMHKWDGTRADLVPALEQNVYQPISPRLLAASFVNQDYPTSAMRAVLQDSGYSDAHCDLINAAIENRSISALQNSYMAEVLDAYGEGAVGDAELSDAFTAANWGSKARALATKRAAVIRQRNLIKETIANYRASVYDGQITPAQFENALTAAGAQSWKVSMEGSFATMRAALKGIIAAQRAAAKELTIQENSVKRAYLAEYQAGNLNTATLAAALLTIPIPPPTVDAIVLQAENARVGRSRYLYGKLMTPEAAVTLRGLVKALTRQFTDTLIDANTFKDALLAAGLDNVDAQEILAAAAAGTVSLKKGSSHQRDT